MPGDGSHHSNNNNGAALLLNAVPWHSAKHGTHTIFFPPHNNPMSGCCDYLHPTDEKAIQKVLMLVRSPGQ